MFGCFFSTRSIGSNFAAIHDATGVWIHDLPASPERILAAEHRLYTDAVRLIARRVRRGELEPEDVDQSLVASYLGTTDEAALGV